METLTFPDTVKALIPYLSTRLAARSMAATVASRIPTTRPPRSVRVIQTGGIWRDIATANPLILVECWDADEAKTYALAAMCLAEIEAATRSMSPIAAGIWISAAEDAFSLPVNFPDPVTALARFQFTASLLTSAIVL